MRKWIARTSFVMALVVAGCSTMQGQIAESVSRVFWGDAFMRRAQTDARMKRSADMCKVIGITDGDTLTCLLPGNRSLIVRLDQIDAPEKGQPFGNAAKMHLSGFVFGKLVRLEKAGVDKYGRTLAQVWTDDGNVNRLMVQDGYAWAYKEYVRDSTFLTLESEARQAGRALWSESNPVRPSDFRSGKIAVSDGKIANFAEDAIPSANGEQVRKLNEYAAPRRSEAIKEGSKVQKYNANNRSALAASPHSGKFSCSGKMYCKQMRSCAEAQFYLRQCGVYRLDRDGDGVACESLCGG